jgi:hypothetical protein
MGWWFRTITKERRVIGNLPDRETIPFVEERMGRYNDLGGCDRTFRIVGSELVDIERLHQIERHKMISNLSY